MSSQATTRQQIGSSAVVMNSISVTQDVMKATFRRKQFKKIVTQNKRSLRNTVTKLPVELWPTVIEMSSSLYDYEQKQITDQRQRYSNLMNRFHHDFWNEAVHVLRLRLIEAGLPFNEAVLQCAAIMYGDPQQSWVERERLRINFIDTWRNKQEYHWA